jgi:hypothetical protein
MGITSLTPFLFVGTLGGAVSSLLITWLGLSITNSASRISLGQLGRISLYFFTAGILSGFVGQTFWLFSCAFKATPLIQDIVACNDSSSLIWKLGTGLSSLIGLASAQGIMLVELGVTGVMRRLKK